MNKIFLKGIGWSLLDKSINQFGSIFVSLYIARLIGPESFGLIGMLTVFILLSESVLGGFSQALIQKSHDLTEKDSSTVFYINLCWALFFYLVLYILAPYIAVFYRQPELINIARVLFLVIFFNSLMVVFRAQLTIKMDFKSQTLAATYGTAISAIVAIYAAINGYGYWSVVIMLLSKTFIVLISLFFYSKWLPQLVFSKESFLSLFKFGSYLMFASILSTLTNNLSVILIGRFFNASNVGYFAQATNMSNSASQIITSTLQGVTYPLMTSLKHERDKLTTIYQQLIKITMCISFPLLIGLAAVSKEVVLLLLGPEWKEVIPLLIALCFARSITPISAINMNILNAIGRSDLFLKIDLCKIPISILAIVISIPFGITALAWSMVGTSFLAFFINAYYPYKLFDFGPIQQLKIAKNYIVATTIMYLCLLFIHVNTLLFALGLKVLLGMIVYIMVLVLLKDQLAMKMISIILLKVRNK